MKKMMIAAGVLFVLAGVRGVADDGKSYDYSFEVNPANAAVKYQGVDAHVDIRSHDGNVVEFVFEKKLLGNADDRQQEWFDGIHPEVDRDGDTITIEIKYPKNKRGGWFSGGFRTPRTEMKATLTVPRTCGLNIRVVDGDILGEGIDGDQQYHSVDGDIELKGCAGDLEINLVDGDARLLNCSGAVDARTVDGDLSLEGALQKVDCQSTDGDVRLVVQGIDRMGDDWKIRSVDGDVDVVLPASLNCELKAGSLDGHVKLDGFSAITVHKKKRSRLLATLGDGGPVLSISSVDGDVTVSGR